MFYWFSSSLIKYFQGEDALSVPPEVGNVLGLTMYQIFNQVLRSRGQGH